MKDKCCVCGDLKEVEYILTPAYMHGLLYDRPEKPVYVKVCKECLEKHGQPKVVKLNNFEVYFEDGTVAKW